MTVDGTMKIGWSATGVTVTGKAPVCEAAAPGPDKSGSRLVAVTVSVKSLLPFGGGVTVRPSSWAGVSVQVPSVFLVPADNEAPGGRPAMVMETISAGSGRMTSISSGMGVSSPPEAGCTIRTGASGAGRTPMVTVATLLIPAPSLA